MRWTRLARQFKAIHRPLKDEPGGQVDWRGRGGQKYRHVTDETPGLSIVSAPRTPAQGGWMDSGQRGNTQDIHGHTFIFFLWLSGRLVRVLVSSLAVCWSRCLLTPPSSRRCWPIPTRF